MDPNGSYRKDARSSESESNISPLQEALRGTPAKPMLDEFLALMTQPPYSHASQVPTMMSPKNESELQNQTNVPLAPLHVLPHTNSYNICPGRTITSQPIIMESSQKNQEMFSQQDFLTTPIENYFNPSQQMQILSMESPSITSLLQGDPIASVHAHLNTIGALDHGPIFENPTRLFTEVNSLPLGSLFSPLNQCPLTSNTIHQQHIQHGALCNEDPYGIPTPSGPFATFPSFPREGEPPVGGPDENFGGDVMQGSMSSGYRCKLCNATFNSSQAYGGHMSHHNKAKKKNM